MKKEHEKLEERRATCTNLTKLVDELEAKQKNVRVALSIINRNLSYIFSSNDRFKIDYRNNNYVLLSNVDMNRANEVRPVFRKLEMIVEKTGCAIVLIGHLNKSSGTQSTYRGFGSIDIMAAVRSLIFIGKARKDCEPLAICNQAKYNEEKKEAISMARTANVFARVEPEVKEQAEQVLDRLGIPMSNAVGMFLRQIVLQRGIPFEMKLPAYEEPVAYGSLTKEQFNAEIEKGMEDIKAGRVYSADEVEVEAEMKRKFGI